MENADNGEQVQIMENADNGEQVQITEEEADTLPKSSGSQAIHRSKTCLACATAPTISSMYEYLYLEQVIGASEGRIRDKEGVSKGQRDSEGKEKRSDKEGT